MLHVICVTYKLGECVCYSVFLKQKMEMNALSFWFIYYNLVMNKKRTTDNVASRRQLIAG